jgi:hypothetical protein
MLDHQRTFSGTGVGGDDVLLMLDPGKCTIVIPSFLLIYLSSIIEEVLVEKWQFSRGLVKVSNTPV